MKIFLFLLVFATFSLSTYAGTINANLTKDDNKEILNSLNKQVADFNKQHDDIKIKKVNYTINKLTAAECTITVGIAAEESLFGNGFKVSISCSMTAPTCAEAAKAAYKGCMDSVGVLKQGLAWVENYISNLF